MIKREFFVPGGYLHMPIRVDAPECAYYVGVLLDGVEKNEFLIEIAAPGESFDFYAPMDITCYGTDRITLVCGDEHAPENLFDGLIPGGPISEHPELYADLYREESRQQVHFSPARGWLNDPNGLFLGENGVFHMYFQHNPFSNHHFGTNVSWGHAMTTDGVHFTEHGDAIMPLDSVLNIASGSAIIDTHNLSGMGEDTVLAAFTNLISPQYHGRPAVTSGVAQNLWYSRDGGMTYAPLTEKPIIPVPAGKSWRDPKIFQLDEKTLCIAVYETYEDKNCVSFYRSTDCREWTFCSRNMDLYECPDFFLLRTPETDETFWVLYGGNGKYSVGKFENFVFEVLEAPGYIDYGTIGYAGQTFNHAGGEEHRLHVAWLRDRDQPWHFDENEPNRKVGFSQSMSLMCKLSLHRTPNGLRLFREPIEAISTLRGERSCITLERDMTFDVPSELVFKVDLNRDLRFRIGGNGFDYDAATRRITSTAAVKLSETERVRKATEISTSADTAEVRVFLDARSIEIFFGGEVSMSFFAHPAEEKLNVRADAPIEADLYTLRSIWDKN